HNCFITPHADFQHTSRYIPPEITGADWQLDHFDHAQAQSLFGFDAAYQLGSVSFQGEYIMTHLNRFNDREDVDLDGWYAYVSWFPTGEHRNYTMAQSRFVGPGSKNAIELLARFSTIDLNDLDAGVEGGEAENITLGMNWYINNNVRWMINYTIVDNDEYADGDGDFIGDDDFSFLGTRIQILF
ncbi:MAG: porin, partial [Acidobacteriota bacterium]